MYFLFKLCVLEPLYAIVSFLIIRLLTISYVDVSVIASAFADTVYIVQLKSMWDTVYIVQLKSMWSTLASMQMLYLNTLEHNSIQIFGICLQTHFSQIGLVDLLGIFG